MFSGASHRALVDGEMQGWWPALQRGCLWTASVPYAWVARLRNRLYDIGWKRCYHAPVPVVSVGNLTLGGTGKTPCVEYVAGFFYRQNRRVAILSRGYGRCAGANDEARVLHENLPEIPHLQGPNRVSLAVEAIKNLSSDILVLDDGFQHRRLARDLDVVLVDATDRWDDHLFPRGLLREPYAELRRAGIVILTRANQVACQVRDRLKRAIAHYAPMVPIVEADHCPVHLINCEGKIAPLECLHQKPVAAFCGIGNPNAFRKTITDLGATAIDFKAFSDHHPYSSRDLHDLNVWARQQNSDAIILTTQKDLVKLRYRHLGGKPLWSLRIRLHFREGQGVFDQKLLSVMR
jgi:tetraacyldisaccharide 4'-kinase